jgi:hypothetical protein
MVDEKPIQHQLHDLAHQVMDEIDYANEHLGHAYEAMLQFGDRVVGQEHEWANILREKAGKVQAASDILITTAEEVHNPETWDIPAFGDEPNMARA